MSSVLVDLLYQHVTMMMLSGSCSHRLKQLEKWNRRGSILSSCVCFSSIASRLRFEVIGGSLSPVICEVFLSHLGLQQSMDTSTHESVFEYLSFHHDLKRPYVGHDQVSCSKQSTIEESQVKELGIALSRILHVQNVPLTVSNCDEPSGEEDQFCEEVKIDEPKCLNETTQKVMNKSATFPSANNQLSCPSPEDGKNQVPGTELHGDNDMKTGNPACSRSLSLPAPSKLVSAMKGGREKQGITPLKNLTVKWERDVYDPPTTSVSHSVKSQNQQRLSSGSKSNKKKQQGKNKKNKGKSSRGSNGDKKQHRKYNCNSDLRPMSQDAKCGSSFLRTSALSTVHMSVAEAA